MGLAIARGVLAVERGTISAENCAGWWRPVHDGRAGGGEVTRTMRILLVDDDVSIQRAVAPLLRSRGYEVDVVGTGAEAPPPSSIRRPTWSCWISVYLTSKASRSAAGSASNRRCRSSSCRPAAARRTKSRRSTSARTTTSRSRSARRNSSPASASRCGAWPKPRRPSSSASRSAT